MTPLMFAAQAGSEACVRRLLEAGAHPNAVDEEDLWASLHFAAKEAHLGVCGLLLEARADTRALNCDDHTALQVAQMEEAAARPGSSSRGGRAATRASGSLGEGRWALRRSLSRVERPSRIHFTSMTHLSILPIVASRPQRIEVLPTLPRNQRRRRCWGLASRITHCARVGKRSLRTPLWRRTSRQTRPEQVLPSARYCLPQHPRQAVAKRPGLPTGPPKNVLRTFRGSRDTF
ncbi:unnamed protein product [Prorocentrum cordatum]|uniref:Uncharacterized protein n=1 Tax=Prorocentrum cordatum TaxID=2364126 RepID=A0ABN9XH85_9DINO|nr:unnamed protein product [Polarella glacialis]